MNMALPIFVWERKLQACEGAPRSSWPAVCRILREVQQERGQQRRSFLRVGLPIRHVLRTDEGPREPGAAGPAPRPGGVRQATHSLHQPDPQIAVRAGLILRIGLSEAAWWLGFLRSHGVLIVDNRAIGGGHARSKAS